MTKEKRKLEDIESDGNQKQVKKDKKLKTTKNSDIKSDPSNNGSTSGDIEVVKNKDEPLVRVYADGIYDLFHFGHARSLEQAKRLFPNTYLIVGVCNDEVTHRLKGKTVMNGEERAESLRHCKWVDEVVENAPWIVTQEFIDTHRIDFVAHGEDLCLDKDGNDVYQFVKDQGKFKVIKRTDGISTSDIILRIVKDYDSYVKRNLARGYTGKQMNVSLLKENTLKVEEKISQFKTSLKDRLDQFKLWSDQTENNIVNFLQKFSKRVPKQLTDPKIATILDLNEDPLSPDTLHILNSNLNTTDDSNNHHHHDNIEFDHEE